MENKMFKVELKQGWFMVTDSSGVCRLRITGIMEASLVNNDNADYICYRLYVKDFATQAKTFIGVAILRNDDVWFGFNN